MKSKVKKYVHRCKILSRVDEFAHIESLISRFEYMGHLKMARGTRWSSQILQEVPRIVSRVHAQSCPRNQKSKKRGNLSSFQASKSKESKEPSVYQARSLRTSLRERDQAAYAPAPSPGRPHTRVYHFTYRALALFGIRLAQVPGVDGLSTAPPPFPRFTHSAEALPKFAQPPVATRASEVVRERVRARESD